MYRAVRSGVLALTLFLLATIPFSTAHAQELSPRYGVGLHTNVTPGDGFGLGLTGRLSMPINLDLSLALDAAFTGFILKGRNKATYLFHPQLSAIVTLPQRDNANSIPYLLTGFGGYFDLGNDAKTKLGPSIHLGLGWVQALSETTLFYEVNPALIIGETSVEFALPLRIGLIF